MTRSQRARVVWKIILALQLCTTCVIGVVVSEGGKKGQEQLSTGGFAKNRGAGNASRIGADRSQIRSEFNTSRAEIEIRSNSSSNRETESELQGELDEILVRNRRMPDTTWFEADQFVADYGACELASVNLMVSRVYDVPGLVKHSTMLKVEKVLRKETENRKAVFAPGEHIGHCLLLFTFKQPECGDIVIEHNEQIYVWDYRTYLRKIKHQTHPVKTVGKYNVLDKFWSQKGWFAGTFVTNNVFHIVYELFERYPDIQSYDMEEANCCHFSKYVLELITQREDHKRFVKAMQHFAAMSHALKQTLGDFHYNIGKGLAEFVGKTTGHTPNFKILYKNMQKMSAEKKYIQYVEDHFAIQHQIKANYDNGNGTQAEYIDFQREKFLCCVSTNNQCTRVPLFDKKIRVCPEGTKPIQNEYAYGCCSTIGPGDVATSECEMDECSAKTMTYEKFKITHNLAKKYDTPRNYAALIMEYTRGGVNEASRLLEMDRNNHEEFVTNHVAPETCCISKNNICSVGKTEDSCQWKRSWFSPDDKPFLQASIHGTKALRINWMCCSTIRFGDFDTQTTCGDKRCKEYVQYGPRRRKND